ncbi:MAG: HAD family hydrolase [Clostridia bacterium]|nr:HAD family hydrolase [Clostridia bacterium]
MNLKYNTVIFDLDGTILNTLDDLAASVNFALEKCGYPLRTTDEVRQFVGNGIGKLMERSAPEGTGSEELAKYHEIFTAHYKVHCADKTCPYDGIAELINKLRSLGCRTAVVSNKADYAVKSLCEDYFPGMLDMAVGERDGIRRKPCPDSVNEVMESIGADRANTLYVGDSDVDVETAKNAGVDCAAVTWGFRSREFLIEHGAETIAETVEELYKIIVG